MGILQDTLETFDASRSSNDAYVATHLQSIRSLFERNQANPNETYPMRIRDSDGQIVQINVPIIRMVLDERYPVAYLALFIEYGAKINCVLSPYQESPLHYCIAYCLNDKAKLLLANGADYDQKNSAGFTPLMTAIDEANHDGVAQLLTYPVSLTIRNGKGETALALAERFKNKFAASKIEEALEARSTCRASYQHAYLPAEAMHETITNKRRWK